MNNFTSLKIVREWEKFYKYFKLLQDHDAYIAGGFARYCCSPLENPSKYKDIDIWMIEDDLTKRNKLIRRLEETGFVKIRESVYAVELSDNTDIVQVINPRIDAMGDFQTFGEPEIVCTYFDFTITQCALTSEFFGIASKSFETDEFKKNLVIKCIRDPMSTMTRVLKYVKKGYFIDTDNLHKIFLSFNKQPGDYKLTLKHLIDARKEKEQEQISSVVEKKEDITSIGLVAGIHYPVPKTSIY
jgi:hypothetical protein